MKEEDLEQVLTLILIIFSISLVIFAVLTLTHTSVPENKTVTVDNLNFTLIKQSDLRSINSTHYSDIACGEDLEVYHNIDNLNKWLVDEDFKGYKFKSGHKVGDFNSYVFSKESGTMSSGEQLEYTVKIYYNPHTKDLVKLYSMGPDSAHKYIINIKG